jgi:Protein of unknown function (DUF3618)
MTQPDGAGDAAALREEIRRTRADLGETVQALAGRADVKARIKESAAHAWDRAGQTAGVVRTRTRDTGEVARRNPVPWAAIGAGLMALVIVVAVARGRRR